GRSRARPARKYSRESSGCCSARRSGETPARNRHPCYAHVMSTPSGPAFSSRTERLLSAPVLPMILRLSAPGLLLVAFTTLVSIGDTYFVGRLGTEPLAGLALVFPMLMLLQMTSAGAMGGGVASAIARALGAGDQATARRLVVHALVIALAMGAAFTLLLLTLGRPFYRLL